MSLDVDYINTPAKNKYAMGIPTANRNSVLPANTHVGASFSKRRAGSSNDSERKRL